MKINVQSNQKVNMKHLNATATKIALKLYELLANTDHTKVDNANGSFMAVCLEKRQHIKNYGQVFSVAHYYTQEGDLMSDPYMEFVKADLDGQIYPILFEQHGVIPVYNEVLAYNEDGTVKGFKPRMQKDLVTFANMWMQNINYQQFTP
jgi:hypothetical protein